MCSVWFQLLELSCFELLHVLATRIDDVISTSSLQYNIATGHSNLVLVVELLFLLSKILSRIFRPVSIFREFSSALVES